MNMIWPYTNSWRQWKKKIACTNTRVKIFMLNKPTIIYMYIIAGWQNHCPRILSDVIASKHYLNNFIECMVSVRKEKQWMVYFNPTFDNDEQVRSPSRTSKQIGAEILQPCYISQLWIPLVYTTLHFLQRKTCVQHKSNYPFFIQHQDYATFFPLEMKYFQFFSSCHSILIRTSVSWNKFQQNPV